MDIGITALQREVKDIELKIRSLLEMGITISSDKEIDSLLDTILSKSKKIADCEAGSIFLMETVRDETGERQILRFKAAQNDRVSRFQLYKEAFDYTVPINKESIAGYTAVTKKILNISDAYHINKNELYKFDKLFDKKIGFKTKSLLAVPIVDSTGQILGVLELINKIDKRSYNGSRLNKKNDYMKSIMSFLKNDVESIQWITGLAGVALENVNLLSGLKNHTSELNNAVKERTKELNEAHEVLKKELNTAHRKQIANVPQDEKKKQLSRAYSLEISSYFKPCNKLAGNFWDMIDLDQEIIGILLIDFAGQGIAPVLNTFLIKEFFQTEARNAKSPAMFVDQLNSYIYKNINTYATCIYTTYNRLDKKLIYCRGGHPPAIWYKKSADELIELDSKGKSLGIKPNSKYEEKEIKLKTGDKIIFNTNGITEMENNPGEIFGDEQLKSTIFEHRNKSSSEILELIIKSHSEFTGKTEFDDDITLVVIEPNLG